MIRTRFVALAALLAVAPLAAQTAPVAHPDFSGTWILDSAKTIVDGPLPAASAATYVIAQHGDSITVDEDVTMMGGAMHVHRLYATDGYQWKNTMDYQGTSLLLTSVLSWKDGILNVTTTTDVSGTPVDQAELWAKSADGNTLSVHVNTSVNGDQYASMTMVFNKKP